MKISHLASLTLFTSLSVLNAATQPTQPWAIDPMHSQAGFQIRHLGVSNVRGAISHITGTVQWDETNPANSRVSADLDTNTVDTGNEARDKHLKNTEFFNVEKYPAMHFQSTSVKRTNGKLQVFGDLTLAGVTKPVTLDVDDPAPPQKGMQGGLVTASPSAPPLAAPSSILARSTPLPCSATTSRSPLTLKWIKSSRSQAVPGRQSQLPHHNPLTGATSRMALFRGPSRMRHQDPSPTSLRRVPHISPLRCGSAAQP